MHTSFPVVDPYPEFVVGYIIFCPNFKYLIKFLIELTLVSVVFFLNFSQSGAPTKAASGNIKSCISNYFFYARYFSNISQNKLKILTSK